MSTDRDLDIACSSCRLVVARSGEMDLAKWWNAEKGQGMNAGLRANATSAFTVKSALKSLLEAPAASGTAKKTSKGKTNA